mmetsp:Transcript_36785/g.73311  ORF Transcript_36785/g.73311 Transcript_36785/m.73311 type:complete len:202 (-) Transcript_36785:174-779(-)
MLIALSLCTVAMSTPIKLYTHTACPFAQRVWIALEASGLPYEKVDVNLYGSGGFDKSQLKKVETAGGLPPKGYIPVMQIGDEVVRESSVLVRRVAEMAAPVLEPEEQQVADELISLCNALPTKTRSNELDELIFKANGACAQRCFLAGDRFSVADACLLPFLQRVEDQIPADANNLRAYMARAHKQPAFAKTVVSSWWWWW